MKTARAVLLSLATVICCVSALPILMLLKGKTKGRFKKRFMGLGLIFTGIKAVVHGEIETGPLLIVSNHCSYLDILVLQQLNEGYLSFTPKSEIGTWPVIGWVTNRYDAVYIDRSRRATGAAANAVMEALHEGRRVSLFPEGTTSNGRSLGTFKPSILSTVERWDRPEPLRVQPVAIVYCHADGRLLQGAEWETIAWYGEMELAPHLWHALKGLGLRADIVCLPSTILREGESRKELAVRLEGLIRGAMDGTLAAS